MKISKIRKRDGNVVDFQKNKIQIAIAKAAQAVGTIVDTRTLEVITDHAVRHIELYVGDSLPEVEKVQDLVERTLMEYGLFEVAKAYIIYRAEHSKIRQIEKEEVVAKIEKSKLNYVDEKGKSKALDRKKLHHFFTEASKGYEKIVDLDALVNQCEGNLYDGITYQELNKALTMTTRSYIEKDPAYSFITANLALSSLYIEVFGPTDETNFVTTYRKSFITNLKRMVEEKRLQPEILDFDLEKVAAQIDPSRDHLFEYLGLQTLYDRYLLRVQGGEDKLETPQGFWMRIALGTALQEKDKEDWAAKFYDLVSQLLYVPSTPTLFHAGTTYPQLSSCYLNTVGDDLRSIFKVFSDNAQLSKYSGGIGTDWSSVRGTGALIKATNVGSQGVVPFLKIANDVTVAINRSGKRRGATCVYLETWHYDFEDFLDLRRNTGDERRRTHDMNTANWIPDLFMKRVNEGGMWTLFSPDETPDLHELYGQAFEKRYSEYEKLAEEGKIKLHKSMPAKDLWRKMITMLFETGHPWVTFKDPCNVRSPQDHAGVIHHSNLCTEITLNTSLEETAVCNLGSVNLPRHMEGSELNLPLLRKTVLTAMRMLDNVIDLNFYPTDEAKNSNMKHRPVGLGIMGFQDALYLSNIDFDSETAVKFADESMEYISYYAILGSSELAKERGAYGSYKGSKWDRGIFPVDTLELLEKERNMPIPVSRSATLDWNPVKDHVKKYGMRNSNTMAIAPTATISNISGSYPCIEPIYQNLYVKSNMSGEFTVVNQYLVEDLKKLGLWTETMLEELKHNNGNVQEITSIPPRLRNKYKTVFDIGMQALIKIAAYRGKWIDQSQSLNIFFEGTSGKLLGDVYMLAWHMGLKTTYYLRTLAASSIEKSTLDINKWKVPTNAPVEKPAEALQPVPPLVVSAPSIEPAPEPVFAPPMAGIAQEVAIPTPVFTATKPFTYKEKSTEADYDLGKACLINDPTCEACQ